MYLQTIGNNCLGYVGEAKVTIKDRGYAHSFFLHNRGTDKLGTLISIVLAGDLKEMANIGNRRPSSIGFEYKAGDSEDSWISLLAGRVPLSSSVWGAAACIDPNSKVDRNLVIGMNKYSAIFTSNSVRLGFINSLKGRPIRLILKNSMNQDLAEIRNDKLDKLYIALSAGQDALIDWSMYLVNSPGS